jgi:nickel/cobalt exporter
VILIGLRLFYVKGRGFLIACRELALRQVPDLAFASASASSTLSTRTFQLPERRPGAIAMRGGQRQVVGCTAHAHGFHCHDDHDHHGSGWSHAHAPEPAMLAGMDGWRRGLAAVVAVGLRPCSGAIIVLIFALAQGLFWTGVGATLIMGLGTAATVAAIATLAVSARGLASRVARTRAGLGMLVMRAIEVGASAFIVAFGILLLAGYMASERLWMFTG